MENMDEIKKEMDDIQTKLNLILETLYEDSLTENKKIKDIENRLLILENNEKLSE